jgi:hypothetical protein
LHGLAEEQRAMVDKWLFDKSLTYQEVSQACREMFGLQVSRSSVGRYHEREARGKVRRKKGASARAPWKARGMNGEERNRVTEGRQSLHPIVGTLEENYQESLKRMASWALEEMQWPVADERDVKTVLRFMRVLIAARRERNEAMMAEVARKKFEMKAARECLHVMIRKKTMATDGTDFTEQKSGRQRRGEKDPMMMWDFPDGEIRRMPLMRRQAKPAPTGGTENC